MTDPNTFVIVVDTQVDFVMSDGLLAVPGAETIVTPGIRFLANLDPKEIAGVLFTYDTHERSTYFGSAEHLGDEAAGIRGFPLHCELGTPGWANVFNPLIVPRAIPVHALRKGVFDMWADGGRDDGMGWIEHLARDGAAMERAGATPRDEFFGEAGGSPDTHCVARKMGVDTVRVIGVASDFCVRWAVAGLLERGYRVEVVGDLTAGIERDIERTIVDEFAGRVLVV